MELLNLKNGVLTVLAAIGIYLSAIAFNNVQEDSKSIQAILLAQQANTIQLTTLVTDMKNRADKVDALLINQNDLDRRVFKLEVLAARDVKGGDPSS